MMNMNPAKPQVSIANIKLVTPAMVVAQAQNSATKPRKLNFTLPEVECLLKCVLQYRDVVLFSVQGGRGDVSNKNSPWLQTWEKIAVAVSKVEKIHRTEADCRKKWTYLKWEARNTSKPTRDIVSKCVFDILTSRNGDSIDINLTKNNSYNNISYNNDNRQQKPTAIDNLYKATTNFTDLPPLVKIESGDDSGSGGETYPAMLCRSILMNHKTDERNGFSNVPTPAIERKDRNVSNVMSNISNIQEHVKSQVYNQYTKTKISPSPVQEKKLIIPDIPSSQDVCLRWNSHHSNMQKTFSMLLDSEEFVDVTLACEGQFIKCHKMVLSSCSGFFSDLFRENPCQHPVVVLRGSALWEIRALVDFMYRGEVNVQQNRLAEFLAAAEEFRVKGLANSAPREHENSNSSDLKHEEIVTDESVLLQAALQQNYGLKRKYSQSFQKSTSSEKHLRRNSDTWNNTYKTNAMAQNFTNGTAGSDNNAIRNTIRHNSISAKEDIINNTMAHDILQPYIKEEQPERESSDENSAESEENLDSEKFEYDESKEKSPTTSNEADYETFIYSEEILCNEYTDNNKEQIEFLKHTVQLKPRHDSDSSKDD